MTKSAAIVGFVNSVMYLLLEYGVAISPGQQAAITGCVNALMLLVAVLFDPKVPFGRGTDGGSGAGSG